MVLEETTILGDVPLVSAAPTILVTVVVVVVVVVVG